MNEPDSASPKRAAEGYRARDLVSVPGLISLSRGPLAVAFPFLYRRPLEAIALLVLAGATDVLDGWVARRRHLESVAGEVLDGAMDKLFGLSVLATLVAHRSLSILEALVLSSREIVEALLLTVALVVRPRATDAPRPANTLGKLATVLQFAAVVMVLLHAGPRTWSVAATGVCGVLAALAYWRREFARGP